MRKICLLFGILLFMVTGFACADDFKTVPPSVSLTPEVTYQTKTQELKTYFNQLKDFVQAEWMKKDVKNTSADRVLASFKIDKDGFITEPEIVLTSGSLFADNQVLDTIRSLKQFKPLPKNFKNPIYVKLYFNPSQKQYVEGGSEPDFGPYMRELQRRIKMNWNPPKGKESARVVLMFRIDKSGKLMSSSLFRSSGDKSVDNAAMAALQQAAPFKPLPSEFKGKSIDIQFKFDYNVWGRSDYKNMHSPVIGESMVPQQTPGTSSYYQKLDDSMTILNKNLIRHYQGYDYISVLKVKPLFDDAYLWSCKLDCKNRQIGIKKSYQGSVLSSPMHLLGFTQMVNVFTDEVKMQSVDKNQDYLKIYNYVCQP